MALSERQRFDVLTRDGYACRYCGATAPDTKLHVDHIIPVVRGGTDDMDNLITACDVCNRGKKGRAEWVGIDLCNGKKVELLVGGMDGDGHPWGSDV